MPFLLFLAIVFTAVLITFPLLWYRRRKIDADVKIWATENDYELVKYEERTFAPLTIMLRKTRNQAVVWVEIKEHSGKLKKGWLILGSLFCKWAE